MKEIILTMKEINAYKEIKYLVDNGKDNSSRSKNRVAKKLNCTLRNVNLLINKYKNLGKAGFSHKNKSKKPIHSLSDNIKDKILNLYQTNYYDYNWKHFKEALEENHEIIVSYTAIYNLLKANSLISRLALKRTKKVFKIKLENKENLTKKEKIILQSNILEDYKSHPRKPRSKYFGELIQVDASSFFWIGNIYAHLHLAIDDATGEVVGAYFDTQETLRGYYSILSQILGNYGVPFEIVSDGRSVFEYNSKKTKEDEERKTQFGFACKNLGITVKVTSVPQGKGRVERLNKTFQQRLPQELRTANVKTLEDANIFLVSYLKKFNRRFSLLNNNTKSIFEDKLPKDKINLILCTFKIRKFDNGGCIKVNNVFYQAYSEGSTRCTTFLNKTEAMFITTFNGDKYINVNDILYHAVEFEKIKQFSENFDEEVEKKKKKKYIPPITHPWKSKNYTKFISQI